MGHNKTNHIIFIDSECILCNRLMQIIHKADKKGVFTFLALQSENAKILLEPFSIKETIDSVVFLQNDKIRVKSEAVLVIAKLLPYPWKLIYVFKVLPLSWLNSLYDFIARNRYSWFGKTTSCSLPEPRS